MGGWYVCVEFTWDWGVVQGLNWVRIGFLVMGEGIVLLRDQEHGTGLRKTMRHLPNRDGGGE